MCATTSGWEIVCPPPIGSASLAHAARRRRSGTKTSRGTAAIASSTRSSATCGRSSAISLSRVAAMRRAVAPRRLAAQWRSPALDGTVMDAAEATIPVADEGLLRGDGVFEVMRLYGGRPFALDEHLARMAGSAERLRLPLDAGGRARRRRGAARGRARRGPPARARAPAAGGGSRWSRSRPSPRLRSRSGTSSSPRCACSTASSRCPTPRTCSRRGWRRSAGSTRRCSSPRTAACSRGRRRRSSTSLDGELFTPPLDDHILASITRRHVIELTGARERITARDDVAPDERGVPRLDDARGPGGARDRGPRARARRAADPRRGRAAARADRRRDAA